MRRSRLHGLRCAVDIPKLGEDIKEHPKYNPEGGNCILVLSCQAGVGDNPPVQQLKDNLHPTAVVKGADDLVEMRSDGSVSPPLDQFREF